MTLTPLVYLMTMPSYALSPTNTVQCSLHVPRWRWPAQQSPPSQATEMWHFIYIKSVHCRQCCLLFFSYSLAYFVTKKYFPGLPHFYSCWVTELYVFICLERTLSIYCRNFHQKCLAWQSRWQVRYHFTQENFWKGNATLSSVFKTRFSKYWAVSSIFDFLSKAVNREDKRSRR